MLKRVTLAAIGALVAATSIAQTPSSVTHTVGSGDTLYGLVAEYYPERMARWTDVAVEIVALNPDAFPQGLDTVMNLGDVLTLVEYGEPPVSAYASSATTQRDDEQTADGNNNAGRSDSNSAVNNAEQPQSSNGDTPASESSSPQATSSSGESDATSDDDPVLTFTDDDSGRQAIGRVVSVTGRSVAIDHKNQQRSLAADQYVYLGDAVTTERDASLSVELVDHAMISLPASSRLMFERYQYDPQQQRGSAVMTLVKGGVRAKTGLLAQHQPDAIAINTAVATVGVRGTEFALRVCAPDSCRVTPSSRTLDPGLYAGVLEGTIMLSNNTGNLDMRRGEFYHVAAPNTMPETAVGAAGLLFESSELTLLNVKIEEERPLSFFGWLRRKVFGD